MSHMRQNPAFFDTLAVTPLFAGLDHAQIAALLGKDIRPTTFPRGAVLFSPTDYTPSLAIVLRGSAFVYRVGTDGRRVLMSRLTPGSVFGMASLFYEEGGFPTEIQAEKACGVLFLSKAWVEDAFARQPRLSRNYIALLSERIHFLNRRLDTLAGDDLPARLLRLLRSLSGGDAPTDGTFTLPFSLSQLAEMLGVGRATLYRALDALEAANAISRDGKNITIMEERS